MRKKLLAVFAHPDDEAFGPAGTLAKYASEGVEIHVLCATRGEAGQWHQRKIKNQKSKIKDNEEIMIEERVRLEHVREKELLKSAEILGIKTVDFLDFIDGTLCNAIYHQLADKIIRKIQLFKPQVILTIERRGVSGHLDHIAVSMITTYSYFHSDVPKKLYYHCLPRELRDQQMEDYFVYFPEGYSKEEITTRIDYNKFWNKKVAAMTAHKSQIKDVKNIIARFENFPKTDHFILQASRDVVAKLPEFDLFSGID